MSHPEPTPAKVGATPPRTVYSGDRKSAPSEGPESPARRPGPSLHPMHMAHSRLICTAGSCDGIVAVVPEEWKGDLVRQLNYRENSRLGYGTMWCPKCRAKWEVGPYNAEAA